MRIRVRFSKHGKVRFISHRDLARVWERAFRRVDLPLAYTGGFSPRPKVSFGLALSTGYESVAEYLDVELAEDATVDVATLPARLTPALPAGIDVTAAAVLPSGADSLQHEVSSCRWEVEVVGAPEARVRELVDEALASETLVVTRERKGQEVVDDIRPAILSLAVVGPMTDDGMPSEHSVLLEAELGTQPRALRPAELVAALGLEEGRVRRTHQWLPPRDGAKAEPLPAQATDALDESQRSHHVRSHPDDTVGLHTRPGPGDPERRRATEEAPPGEPRRPQPQAVVG